MDEEKLEQSFVFYGTTYDTMVELESKSIEDAYKFVKAVAQYGLYGEYDESDPVINALMRQASFGIDKARENRKKNINDGKKGGRKKQFADEEIWKLKDEGMTNAEVAKCLGCSVKTVERANSARRSMKVDTDKTDTDRQNPSEP